MPLPGTPQQPQLNLNQWQQAMTHLVINFCSIFTIPVEMVLYPFYGSRYFPPILMFFTALSMVILPVFFSLGEGISHMMPFSGPVVVSGMFGIGTIAKLFFIGAFIHGVRVWRLMMHMERERISYFEGHPLPIFAFIPCSFFTTRIIIEPIFVFALSIVLGNFGILQPSAATYLSFVAVMLAMKGHARWLLQWEFIRDGMDARAIAPIVAKIVDGSASQEELTTMHLASVPQDMPEDARRAFASHIARTVS